MQKKPLGRSGLSVAPLVLGGNVFGWTADEAMSHRLLDQFVAGGFNAIDTADVYSAFARGNQGGESETVIGAWLKARGRRDDVAIITKVGIWDRRKGLRAANIIAAAEDSLTRLQTDYIDLYMAHRDDAATPLEETMEAFARLVAAGKARALGGSNYTPERLKQALDVSAAARQPRFEVLEPHYNLMERDFENSLRKLAEDEDLGVIPYFALASGFLTGKYRSAADLGASARAGMARNYLNERGLRVLAALDAAAARHGVKPGQIAIAWLARKPGVTAPIASATKPAQLEELMAAARLTLSDEDMAALDAASV